MSEERWPDPKRVPPPAGEGGSAEGEIDPNLLGGPIQEVQSQAVFLAKLLSSLHGDLSSMEQRRQEAEERCRQVLEAFTGHAWVLSAEGRVVFINRRGAALFGADVQVLVGRSLPNSGPLGGQLLNADREVLVTGVSQEGEIEQWGEERVLVRRTLHVDPSGRLSGMVVLGTPVAEALDALETASAQRQSNYLAAIQQRLEAAGAQGSTLASAQTTLLHLLPLVLDGAWTGHIESLAKLCGRSGYAVRKSLTVLRSAGLIESRQMGPMGLELKLLLSPTGFDCNPPRG